MKKAFTTFILFCIGFPYLAASIAASYSYVPTDDTASGGESITNRTWSVEKIYSQIHLTGGIGPTELASTTVTPGSYTNTNLTVDADGRITAASNGTAGASLSGDNTFTGANTIGDGGDLQQTYLDSTPGSDDTWSGAKIDGVAGEAIAQWDLVYNKNASGTNKWYKYDANGTDKLLCIGGLGIAVTSAAGDASSFTIGIGTGVARNDGWSHTTDQDEGKGVYASGTPGAITLTAPSTAGDEVVIVGRVLEENVILFNLSATIPVELESDEEGDL